MVFAFNSYRTKHIGARVFLSEQVTYLLTHPDAWLLDVSQSGVWFL